MKPNSNTYIQVYIYLYVGCHTTDKLYNIHRYSIQSITGSVEYFVDRLETVLPAEHTVPASGHKTVGWCFVKYLQPPATLHPWYYDRTSILPAGRFKFYLTSSSYRSTEFTLCVCVSFRSVPVVTSY